MIGKERKKEQKNYINQSLFDEGPHISETKQSGLVEAP